MPNLSWTHAESIYFSPRAKVRESQASLRAQSTELTLLCPPLLMLCHYKEEATASQGLHSSLRTTSQFTSESWTCDLISESESPRLFSSLCGAFIYPNQRQGSHVSLHPWKTSPPESHQLHLWYVCMHGRMHVSICHFGELGSHSRTCMCNASTLRLSRTAVPCSINLSSISLLLFISTAILMKTSFPLCYPLKRKPSHLPSFNPLTSYDSLATGWHIPPPSFPSFKILQGLFIWKQNLCSLQQHIH